VNRTWVKYIEKGTYPDTRRLFSVMRCNHCEDAPCVNICPVTALYIRSDGIVDFSGSRCIGCRSCMQACPYDALYIDPQTHTAAKCNFCSNRVDQGLEPACVVVCPEKAIIVGDMDDPNSKISKTLARETVTVRKPEKGTVPKVFYIDGDSLMLTPTATESGGDYMWSQQKAGVGHYAGKEYENTALKLGDHTSVKTKFETNGSLPGSRRVYDSPDKGRVWGKEVPGYLVTKGLAGGMGILLSIGLLLGMVSLEGEATSFLVASYILMLLGMAGTAALLVLDLDQPKRFVTVLLRPQWNSWLTRGALIISFFSLFVFIAFVSILFGVSKITGFLTLVHVGIIVFGSLTGIYTAFLFAQAKARDFWQSPLLPFEMATHTILLGSGALLLVSGLFGEISEEYARMLQITFFIAGASSLLFGIASTVITHPTQDAHFVAKALQSGEWKISYWLGLLLTGLLPMISLAIPFAIVTYLIVLLAVVGTLIMNRAVVYAPQDIKLV
jgi:Fe-S-cluster-containing dehydrogenase component/formate-dependent nitrite reductase membrane component NrfD